MNRRVLAVIGLIILGILLFWGGTLYGQSRSTGVSWLPGWMMGNSNRQTVSPGTGMQGVDMQSMMGNQNTGQGMMDSGMMGMMGSFNRSGLLDVEPLSVADAEAAVQNYLSTLNNDDPSTSSGQAPSAGSGQVLTIGEIMVFDNHAYAQIVEESTGNGAFEVLVDPVTRNVFPEPGPNMMWNTQYSPMSNSGMGLSGMMGNGMMGSGMMGGFAPGVEPTVSATQAVELAQAYLDANLSGTTVDETADPFPGYYTIDVLRDGEIAGMLSVNAYTGQVFLHQWHGNFVEMSS